MLGFDIYLLVSFDLAGLPLRRKLLLAFALPFVRKMTRISIIYTIHYTNRQLHLFFNALEYSIFLWSNGMVKVHEKLNRSFFDFVFVCRRRKSLANLNYLYYLKTFCCTVHNVHGKCPLRWVSTIDENVDVSVF